MQLFFAWLCGGEEIFLKKAIDKSFLKSYYFVSGTAEGNTPAVQNVFAYLFLKVGGLIMVFENVARILADQLDADVESITPDTRIAEDLNADSLDVVELLMAVEEEFDVQIPDEEIENLKTVGAVVEYIQANSI